MIGYRQILSGVKVTSKKRVARPLDTYITRLKVHKTYRLEKSFKMELQGVATW